MTKNSTTSIDPPAYSPSGRDALVDENADLVSTLESDLKTQQARILELEALVAQMEEGNGPTDTGQVEEIGILIRVINSIDSMTKSFLLAALKRSLEQLSEAKDIALHDAQVKQRRIADLELTFSAAHNSVEVHPRVSVETGESPERTELKFQVETLSRKISQVNVRRGQICMDYLSSYNNFLR